ncbi:unnamed protein product [Gordionus sp. m RMFG-2023]
MKVHALMAVLILGINTQIWISKGSDSCNMNLDGKTYTFYPGETITPITQCIRCTCNKDYHFGCIGCAPGISNPKCKSVSKPHLAYPGCCPYFVCN